MKKQYGLIQSGNRYYYAIGEQAYTIQIQPFPAAWRNTPSTSWQRVHGNFLHLDNLGLSQGPSGLELDPLAEFDRSAVKVYRLNSTIVSFHNCWCDPHSWSPISPPPRQQATASSSLPRFSMTRPGRGLSPRLQLTGRAPSRSPAAPRAARNLWCRTGSARR